MFAGIMKQSNQTMDSCFNMSEFTAGRWRANSNKRRTAISFEFSLRVCILCKCESFSNSSIDATNPSLETSNVLEKLMQDHTYNELIHLFNVVTFKHGLFWCHFFDNLSFFWISWECYCNRQCFPDKEPFFSFDELTYELM